MQSTPEICKHKGILTHWKDYPEGSVERAKSLGIEVWSTSKGLETTLQLWQTKLAVLQREKPWRALGLKSADEFVKAVVGMTTKEIGKEITKRTQIQKLRRDHPDWTQQRIANETDVDKAYVSRVLTNNCEVKEKVIVPDWIKSSRDQADFRKLPAELREKVAAREVSLNQAAIQAGIRKKPTAEEQCVKAFKKSQSRLVPLKVIVLSLEPHELSVIADWVKERLDGRRLD
jgi:DNA-binding MarR family transcriptional regulator